MALTGLADSPRSHGPDPLIPPLTGSPRRCVARVARVARVACVACVAWACVACVACVAGLLTGRLETVETVEALGAHLINHNPRLLKTGDVGQLFVWWFDSLIVVC